MSVTFRIVAIGERFMSNGNEFIKQSTRTAYMVSSKRTFYFGQFELCKV